MTRLLVDGYNVIHADEELAAAADRDMELARARLVSLLSEYARAGDVEVTVVFDGASGGSPVPVREEVLGVSVVFSARGQSADAVVEAIVVSDSHPERIRVATSDRATQEAVFARGAMRMSARELLAALREAHEDLQGDAEPAAPVTVADRLDDEVKARLRTLLEG